MSRVLIVDDDPAIRDVLRIALNQNGFQTVEAAGGAAALAQFAAARPDIVVPVVLSRTPRDVVQAIWGKKLALGGLGALLLAAGAVLAAVLSRLVARPLARVVAQAQAVAQGGDIVPLPHPPARARSPISPPRSAGWPPG